MPDHARAIEYDRAGEYRAELARAERERAAEDEANADAGGAVARPEKKSRPIEFALGLIMVGVGLTFDGAQLFFDLVFIGPVVNPMVGTIGGLIFFLWSHSPAVHGGNAKRRLAMHYANAGTLVVGLLPYMNSMLPEMTGKVVMMLFISRLRL